VVPAVADEMWEENPLLAVLIAAPSSSAPSWPAASSSAAAPTRSTSASSSARPPSGTASHAAPTPAASAASASSAASLWPVVDEESVERQRIGKDVVSNVAPANGQRIQCLRLLILDGHLNRLEMCVHGNIHSGHGAMHLRSILQLDGDSLVTELHQKPDELHSSKKRGERI